MSLCQEVWIHKANGRRHKRLEEELTVMRPLTLSLMKFMRYLQQNLDRLPLLLLPRFWNHPLLDALARYCTYDQRKRQHFIANFDTILADLAPITA